MDHPAEHAQGDHGHGDVHLPDPSIWPLVVGLAAFVLGAALVVYSRDRDGDWAGPLLGAALVIALVAACGWAFEDGRMKRKAERGEISKSRNARYTQVVTFGIAEGAYSTARGADGVLAKLEGADSALRNLDGFQDLRVIASPAESGVSQVLLETTWADREGLATYDETRGTMLDILAGHPDEVVPGSVQVFDMEVIRDTKDTSFNFGTQAMVGMFGALIVGGFMVGAGLNLFENDKAGGTAAGGGEAPAGPAADTIVAKGTKFTANKIVVPPNTVVTLKFDNKDASPPHNVEIYAGSSTSGPLLKGCTAGCEGDDVSTPLKGGPYVESFTFTTPAVGTYAFNCAAHPDQMTGTLTVQDGAPVPGAAAAPAGSATAAP